MSSIGASGISSSESSSSSEPIAIKELRMSSAHAMIFLSQQVSDFFLSLQKNRSMRRRITNK